MQSQIHRARPPSFLWDLRHLEFEKEERGVSLESKIEFFGGKAKGIRRNEIMAASAIVVGGLAVEN